MRKNTLKQLWSEDTTVLNAWLHIPTGWSAEVMAHQGFDSLTIDLQHGPLGFDAAVPMLQAISTTDTIPLARAHWNEPGIIMKLLDAGAYGIICPMVNTREECEAFVGACRYYPTGYRSSGPTRARIYAGKDYIAHANQEIIAMAMIETAEAVANADAITSVPGLDAIYVGPGDLSMTLDGSNSSALSDTILVNALEQILAACRKNNRIAGIHTGSIAEANQAIEMGFRFITVQSDTAYLMTGAQQVIQAVKGTTTSQKTSSAPY